MDNQFIIQELCRAKNLAVTLAKEIDVKNEKLMEMELKLDEVSEAFTKMKAEMKAENRRLYQDYVVERKRRRLATESSEELLQKYKALNKELEMKQKRLDKREAQGDIKRENLPVEKEQGLQDFWNSQTNIGIKRMGEVDPEPFKEACKKKCSGDWEMKSTELCSLWQDIINNPEWYPFKRELTDGKYQVVFFA
ncbi:hypothetical protein CCACVL1_25153 [Corchorus capsularis]|uniref:Factor of DNA methylation 1-5/IDN2 domain-containing protein n=1 Tax=Corchorus capsularis TaxID=210143 RepID=A0A1R3GLR8_COCAP|nr:hypothetical protein CCACVL1_25153 [Corchorus capsularis]